MDFRGVSIEIVWSDADLIEVAVSARGERFAGAVRIYAGHGELQEMADQFAGFPTSPSDAREFILGAFGDGGDGRAAHFRFYCVDAVGHSCVNLRIESGEGYGGATETVNLVLPVESNSVDEFVSRLRSAGVALEGAAFLREADWFF